MLDFDIGGIGLNSAIGLDDFGLPYSGYGYGSGARSITAGIGDIINDITGTSANNAFAASEAEKARDWERYVAQNQYSWAKRGMEAAGLNPYLMYDSLGQNPGTGPVAHSATPGRFGFGSMLTGLANIIHATGDMTRTMNSKDELGEKKKAYKSVNHILSDLSNSAKSKGLNYPQRHYSDKELSSLFTDASKIDPKDL